MIKNRKKALALSLALLLPVSLSAPVLAEPESEQAQSAPDLAIEKTYVSQDGQLLTRVEPDQPFTVEVVLRDTGLKTSAVTDAEPGTSLAAATIDASRLSDNYTVGEEAVVTLLSKADEPFKVRVAFPGIRYEGGSPLFRFRVGYPSLNRPFDRFEAELPAAEPVSPAEDPTEEPADDPEPEEPDEPLEMPEEPATYEPPATSTPAEKPAAAKPYIIVDKYSYGGKSVQAGKPFDLTIEFRNTSRTLAVENIKTALDTEEGLSIADSSNTFYLEHLGPRAVAKKTIRIKPLGSEKSSSPAVSVAFQYEYVDGGTRQSADSSERIAIPVIEPDRFEITPPVLPETVPAGTETVLSFAYVNKGKGTLSNVAAEVSGDVQALQPVQNLGNFEAGKSGTIDVVVTPQTPGETKCTIKVQYENASGETVHRDFPLTLQVSEPEMLFDPSQEMPMEPEPEESGSSFWLYGGIGALALALIGWWYWRRKKKKKNENELLDWDFDEDDKGDAKS